jgi:predicted transcriptional regulator
MPKQTNMLTLVLMTDIKSKVELNQAEFKKYDVKFLQKGGAIYDNTKEEDKIVEFTEAEIVFLKKQVELNDSQNTLAIDMLSLCKKILSININGSDNNGD